VIFDFNGTLSLDEPILDRLFQDAFAEIGIVFDSAFYYRELSGLSDPEIVVRALELHDRDPEPALCARLLRQKIDRYKEAVLAEPTMTPAIAAFATEIAGRVPVAIGSGAVREEIDFVLAQHGLGAMFEIIVSIDEVANGKPDPETYVRCHAALAGRHPGLAADRCLVIEDTRVGIEAAHTAGMRCVAVHTSGPRDALDRADLVVAGLDRDLAVALLAPAVRQ
jgi:beta-phosphoglucomutase